jgi:putative membrane protein
MKSSVVKIFIIMLSLAALSITALAQDTKKTDEKMKADAHAEMKTDANAQAGKMADHEFAMKAAMDGMTEVELGQIALKNAASEDVKTFAQRMIDDHSKAGDELKTLATSKGLTFPTALDAQHKKTVDDLAKLTGADFDRKYMESMVKDHDKAVALFEKEASSGKDAEAKAWAEKTLPTLREHQQQARDIAGKVGAKTTPAK